MPELPEVETVARDLRAAVMGRRFARVEAVHPKIVRFPVPEVFCQLLTGQRIEAINRRGKFIFCRLDSGDDLVAHLGMTGHLTVTSPDAPLPAHTHMRSLLDDGRELRYDDARRFGRLLLGSPAVLEDARVLPRLGVEPLSADFTSAALGRLLRATTRQLKSALLDQALVAGLGNIYIDEACHLAGVRPTRRGYTVTRAEHVALHDAIVTILTTAIKNRGSSVDNYRDVWDGKGRNQEVLQVYGRSGEPCLRCGTELRRTVIGGRTTVYCRECQH